MAIRILESKLKVTDVFVKKYRSKIDEVIVKDKMKRLKADISNTVKQASNGLGPAIKGVLTSGVTPLGGGPKTVLYYSPFGTVGKYKTRSWNKLNAQYASSKPTSTRFWRKHSQSPYKHGNSQRESLLSMFERAVPSSSRTRSNSTKHTKHSSHYMKATWDITMATPQSPVLQEMMWQSMLTALSSSNVPGHSRVEDIEVDGVRSSVISNEDISMIAYVEGRRPFVRGVSHSIGRRAHHRIQKLLKKQI